MGQRAGCCWNANISDDEKNYKRGLDCIKSGHKILYFPLNLSYKYPIVVHLSY